MTKICRPVRYVNDFYPYGVMHHAGLVLWISHET